MNTAMGRVRNAVYISFVLVIVLVLMTETTHAVSTQGETNAKTPPPPTEFRTLGFFDPDYKYLDAGFVTMLDNKDGTFTIDVVTEAKESVSTIGGTVYLQRWTGKEWQTRTVKTISTSNDWYFTGTVLATVENGYYYRVRVIHYTSHGGVYESGETISGHMLAG